MRQDYRASQEGPAVDCAISLGRKCEKACQYDIPRTTLENNLPKFALLGRDLQNLRAGVEKKNEE